MALIPQMQNPWQYRIPSELLKRPDPINELADALAKGGQIAGQGMIDVRAQEQNNKANQLQELVSMLGQGKVPGEATMAAPNMGLSVAPQAPIPQGPVAQQPIAPAQIPNPDFIKSTYGGVGGFVPKPLDLVDVQDYLITTGTDGKSVTVPIGTPRKAKPGSPESKSQFKTVNASGQMVDINEVERNADGTVAGIKTIGKAQKGAKYIDTKAAQKTLSDATDGAINAIVGLQGLTKTYVTAKTGIGGFFQAGKKVLNDVMQTNPGMKAYWKTVKERAPIIARGAGEKGNIPIRLLENTIMTALPQPTDTAETAQQKLQNTLSLLLEIKNNNKVFKANPDGDGSDDPEATAYLQGLAKKYNLGEVTNKSDEDKLDDIFGK